MLKYVMGGHRPYYFLDEKDYRINRWQMISPEENDVLMRLEEIKPKRDPRTCRISYIEARRTCFLMFGHYCIGTLSEECEDLFTSYSSKTDWVFRIDWPAWELAGRPSIEGLNLERRLHEYVRTTIPPFVWLRTMPDDRENLVEELQRVNMQSNDRFEYMLRYHGASIYSDVYVGRTPFDIVDNLNHFEADLNPYAHLHRLEAASAGLRTR